LLYGLYLYNDYNYFTLEKKKKILVVDDEADVLNTITLLLESEKYEIFKFSSGEEALLYIQENNIDIIISDINMGGINGVQLAKCALEIDPSVRIILISGFVSIIDQIKHFQMGIEKILTKPIDIQELITVIDSPSGIEVAPSCMAAIKVTSLLDLSHLAIDLYVQLTEEKFLKIFNAKQSIDRDRLEQFRAQGVVCLFAKKEDCFNLDLAFYVPTRVSILKTNRVLDFNVYYLSGEEYKKLIPAGSVLNADMLNIIKERNIKVLYIQDKEQPAYLKYLDESLAQYMENKEIPVEDKFHAAGNLVQSRVNEVYNNPTPANIQMLKLSQKHLIDFLKVNNESINDLLKLNEKDQGIHIHSSMVASLSYAILLKIMEIRGNKKEKDKIKALDEYIFESDDVKDIIFTGALLHDIGKSLQNTNGEDKNHSHPLDGYNKLTKLNAVHPKSLEIILQHEEFCDGSGFPSKLRKTNISFFAQVVILVNYFDKLRRHQNLGVAEAMTEIKKIPEKFNKHLIPILEQIVTK
jgi:response regulator RpfG family c-di-GMP phosphodiesterase